MRPSGSRSRRQGPSSWCCLERPWPGGMEIDSGVFPWWRGGSTAGSPEGPVLRGADDHSVAPSVRGPQRDLLQDSKMDVSVQAGFHLVLPVDGYGSGCVAEFGVGIGIDVQTQGGTRHHG